MDYVPIIRVLLEHQVTGMGHWCLLHQVLKVLYLSQTKSKSGAVKLSMATVAAKV